MVAFRSTGFRGNSVSEDFLYPGDLLLGSESLLAGANATAGGTMWTASQIVTGLINRNGKGTSAVTDTVDTAINIIQAMAGNGSGVNVVPGSTFRLMVCNPQTGSIGVTLATNGGVIATGNGVTANLGISAAYNKIYLLTILNAMNNLVTVQCNLTSGSPTAVFVLNSNQVALSEGPASVYNQLMPGASLVGTGIPANATILGMNAGQGGNVGFTMSANATATGTVAVLVGPTISIDVLGQLYST